MDDVVEFGISSSSEERALSRRIVVPMRALRSSMNKTLANAKAQMTMAMMERGTFPLNVFMESMDNARREREEIFEFGTGWGRRVPGQWSNDMMKRLINVVPFV